MTPTMAMNAMSIAPLSHSWLGLVSFTKTYLACFFPFLNSSTRFSLRICAV